MKNEIYLCCNQELIDTLYMTRWDKYVTLNDETSLKRYIKNAEDTCVKKIKYNEKMSRILDETMKKTIVSVFAEHARRIVISKEFALRFKKEFTHPKYNINFNI